jgi:Tfp pilus assembly protein PilN
LINYFKNIAFQLSEVNAIEVKVLQDGNMLFQFCHLKSSKGIISIEKEQNNVLLLEEIIAVCKNNIPTTITFTGKGIISKKVLKTTSETLDDALVSIVNNADINDFAYDVYETDSAFHVSIVRKQRIEHVLNTFIENKINVIGLGLEYVPLFKAIEILNLPITSIVVANQELVFEKSIYHKSEPSEKSESETSIGAQNLVPSQLVAYVSALISLIEPTNLSFSNFGSVSTSSDEFFQMKLYKKALLVGLCFLLGLLMVNTFVFTQQFSKNEILKSQSAVLQNKSNSVKSAESDILEKEKYLNQNGWLFKSRMSFMADRLAASVPSSINLVELNLNPLKMDNSGVKKSTFITNKLFLRGKCHKSTELSNWIQILKNLNWVSDVQMKDYNFDHSNNNATFNIEISYKLD